MSKYARKRDSNHAEVVDALRAAGYQVTDYASLGNVLDLVVRHPSDDFRVWVEVKQPGEKLTPAEDAFCRQAPGLKIVAYSGQDAVDKCALARARRAVTWEHATLGIA